MFGDWVIGTTIVKLFQLVLRFFVRHGKHLRRVNIILAMYPCNMVSNNGFETVWKISVIYMSTTAICPYVSCFESLEEFL